MEAVALLGLMGVGYLLNDDKAKTHAVYSEVQPPLQEGSLKEDVLVSIVGSVTVTVISFAQVLSSSTSIVYVPCVRPRNIPEGCQVVPPSIEYW